MEAASWFTFKPLGMGWEYEVWQDPERRGPSIAVQFKRVKERREGVHADLLILIGGDIRHIEYSFKLDGSLTFGKLANYLDKDQYIQRDLRRMNWSIPWADIFRSSCMEVMEARRVGPELIRLDQVPRRRTLDYLLRPILPLHEVAILFGDSKSGKSYWALWLAAQLALAVPRWPHGMEGPSVPQNVLYLDWETNPDHMSYRLGRVKDGLGGVDFPLWYRQMTRPLGDNIEQLSAQVTQHNIDLVVVDSLGAASGGQLAEGAPAQEAMQSLRALKCTSLVIHHITHEQARAGITSKTRAWGSVFLRALARANWAAEGVSDGAGQRLALHDAGRNDGHNSKGPMWFSLGFSDPDGPVTVGETSQPRALPERFGGTRAEQIWQVLAASAPMSSADIANAIGASEATVRGVLAARTGDLFEVASAMGRGKKLWQLVPSPDDPVPSDTFGSLEF